MKIIENINQNIFRGYDIRGVVPTDINEDIAYTIGCSYGSYLLDKGYIECIIGHDNRISSPALASALIEGIISTGCNVTFLGLVTTPMFYYGRIYKNIHTGIMVTASHNPKYDNGFKFSLDENGNACGEEITNFYEYTAKLNFRKGQGLVTNYNIEKDYINLFNKTLLMGSKKLKVVFDPANAATTVILEKILTQFSNVIDYTLINNISDGNFPSHHPDPAVESNLEQLKNKVIETRADLGVAYDGDGDRVGIVDEKGNYIAADEFMIIIWRNIYDKVKNKKALYDVKCSKALEDELIKLGIEPICYRTGNSYMSRKINSENFSFGGEFSGHIYFKDRFPGFDSGIYASLRVIEILTNTNQTISDLLKGVNKYYSSDETKIKTTDDIKFKVVERMKEYALSKNYNTLLIDGVKILFSYGWILVRASNTGPNLTIRIEADTIENLNVLKEEFIPLIDQYNQ